MPGLVQDWLFLCVAREGAPGPRHPQLRGGEGSTDRITNHISPHDKLVSLRCLFKAQRREELAGGALLVRAEIFCLPPSPRSTFCGCGCL